MRVTCERLYTSSSTFRKVSELPLAVHRRGAHVPRATVITLSPIHMTTRPRNAAPERELNLRPYLDVDAAARVGRDPGCEGARVVRGSQL